MNVGRITFSERSKGDALSRALKTISNPAEGVRLVSHGWKKRCDVCELQTHAKWHEVAKGEVNPVALIELIRGGRFTTPEDVARYVIGVTGIDEAAMQRSLAEERRAEAAVDPVDGVTTE